jgi:hypothetical protein
VPSESAHIAAPLHLLTPRETCAARGTPVAAASPSPLPSVRPRS